MAVRVLFEGTLDKCTVEHGKKDWKRRRFVFKHILDSNIRSLEFYATGTKNWRKAEPKGVLALYPGYEVLKVSEPKRRFVFEIKTVDHTHRLAAHSEDELNQWILVLERESIVNSFFVAPEVNEQMVKLGASDTCHLQVANNELRLLCAKDGRLLVAWPFTCLRRYMSTPGKFIVEAGRRAPTGEGKFTFHTPQHDDVYKVLDNVIKSRAGHKPDTSSHAPLRKTKSVPTDNGKDKPRNEYEQPIAVSPGTEHQMSPGSSNSMKNAYDAPYGHLRSHDEKTASPILGRHVPQAVPGSRLSADSKDGEKYGSLNHPDEDEYSTLDRHLSPSTKGQDIYNILHYHGHSQPLASSQHQVNEEVYSVLGETLPHVVPSGAQPNEECTYNTLDMMPTSQNQIIASALQIEQTYNTLDHATPARPPRKPIQPPPRSGHPVVKPPPKPLSRKLSGDRVDKLQTSHSSSGHESKDMYNTLETNTRPHPPPVRKMSDQVDDDTYNTLETSKARHPPPSPVRKTSDQLKKLQKSQLVSANGDDDTYNTLDHSTKVGNRSPVPMKRLQNFQKSVDEGNEMYNTLDTAVRVGTSPTPAPRLTEQSLKSVDGDEMYNTLDSTTGRATSSSKHNERVDNVPASDLSKNVEMDDVYNTLDQSRTRPSISAPIPAQRTILSHSSNTGSPLSNPVKKDSPTLKSSTSSLQSLRYPLDGKESQLEIPQKSSSLDDLDSPKGAHKPVAAERPLNTRASPSKGRKSSAPAVISLVATNSGKDVRKGGKSRLVLNLKASLEAGGLDFTKPRRKPKKLSRDDNTGERPTHTEVEEQGVTPTEDVFAPCTTPIRAARSSSSPADPNNEEDAYVELD